MWYFTIYNGLSPENRKDAKLYNMRDLLKVYIIEHGKEFLKDKRDKISKVSGQKAVFGSILGSSVQGVCYFFLTILAAGGSIAIGMVVRYVACFERLTTSIQLIISASQEFLLVARRQSTTFEYLDTEGVLNQMVGNRTAISISHRLSSCRFCDNIVVFDKGEVVQQGSHDDLMKNGEGMYYSLWNAQAQYYENSKNKVKQ